MLFVCPVIAVPFPDNGLMQPDTTYENAAISDNMDGVYENGATVTAIAYFEDENYTCAPGSYLPKQNETCKPCTANSYCPGGSFEYSTTENQGITACSTLADGAYPLSATGSDEKIDCYHECVLGDVAHAQTVSGGVHYDPENEDGTNKCEAVACSAGYELNPGAPNLTEIIGETAATDGGFRPISGNGDGYNESIYGITQNGEFVVDYGAKGKTHGYARCSSQSGDNQNYTWTNPTTTASLPDSTGQYCWCQLDGYTPLNGTMQSLSAPWVFSTDGGGADDCANNCALYCAGYLLADDTGSLAFRSAVFDSIESGLATCKPIVYNITYNLDGGTNNADNPSTYTIEDTVVLKAASKEGKVFAGWEITATPTNWGNTSSQSGAAPFTIGSGTYGNITFTATWTDPKFWVEISSDRFDIKNNVAGTFIVDWGDGNVNKYVQNDISSKTWTHPYDTENKYTIRMAGWATGYRNQDNCTNGSFPKDGCTTIQFGSSRVDYVGKITGIKGSLGAIFPTLENTVVGQKQPMFIETFVHEKNMHNLDESAERGYAFPENLFAGIYGQPSVAMFAGTFRDCSSLTGKIQPNLFRDINGTPTPLVFKDTFASCSGLTGEIPADLFAGIHGAPADYMFVSTFSGCNKLGMDENGNTISGTYAIPAELFCQANKTNANPDATNCIYGAPKKNMFFNTFDRCSGLTGKIPLNLFAGIYGEPQSAMFVSTFQNCSGLNGFSNGTTTTSYVPESFLATISDNTTITNQVSNMFMGTSLSATCPTKSTTGTIGTYNVTRSQFNNATKPWCGPCPAGYGEGGGGNISSCYKLCDISDFDNATAVQEREYYDSTDVCKPTACEAGYELDTANRQCVACPDGYYSENSRCVPKTINLQWEGTDSTDVENGANMCIYGETITAPSAASAINPPKGKKFVGWRVKKKN